MGFLLVFVGPGVGVLNSFCPGVGIHPSKKLPGGFAPGDGQAWN